VTSKYEWWAENRASIVAHSYGDLAVYPNDNGDVVLKQQDDMSEDDPHVIVPIDSAERVAAALLEAANLGREIRAENQTTEAAEPAERQPRLALPPPGIKTPRTDTAKAGANGA
jgi:hypothetical protein